MFRIFASFVAIIVAAAPAEAAVTYYLDTNPATGAQGGTLLFTTDDFIGLGTTNITNFNSCTGFTALPGGGCGSLRIETDPAFTIFTYTANVAFSVTFHANALSNLGYNLATSPPLPNSGTALLTVGGAPSEVSDALPEPATWAMMLVGFGAIGFAMRRSRKFAVQLRESTRIKAGGWSHA